MNKQPRACEVKVATDTCFGNVRIKFDGTDIAIFHSDRTGEVQMKIQSVECNEDCVGGKMRILWHSLEHTGQDTWPLDGEIIDII